MSVSAQSCWSTASTPCLAADREPVGVRPADERRVGAERHRLDDVRAVADAAVHQHRRLVADAGADIDERVERRDRPVDLPAAVVGDDDPVDSGGDGPLRVLRGEHTLHEHRQVGQLAEPGEVVPGKGEMRERREHRRGRREHVLLRRLRELLPEDRVAEELRAAFALDEREVGAAEVAGPPAEDGRVERDDDRREAVQAGPLEQAGDDLAVVDPVELEPARRAAHRLGDVLDRRRGGTGQAERDSERSGCACRSHFALLVGDREHTDRCEQERRRRLRAEHLDREIALGVAREHARLDAPALEGLAVRAHRGLAARAACDVAERSRIELLLRQRLPFGGGNGPLRLPRDIDGVLDSGPVEAHAAASSFARSSSEIGRAVRCSRSQQANTTSVSAATRPSDTARSSSASVRLDVPRRTTRTVPVT